MKLKPTLSQKHIISQQLRESIDILHMSALELKQYIEERALENPVIELEGPMDALPDGSNTNQDYTGELLPEYSKNVREKKTNSDFSNMTKEELLAQVPDCKASVRDYLAEQLYGQKLSTPLHAVIEYLMDNLDENGYLPFALEEYANKCSVSPDIIQQGIDLLQNFEPAGIGAQNLGECLCLQMKRTGIKNELAYVIATSYMDLLARNQLGKIAALEQVPVEQVHVAKSIICTLNPKPLNGLHLQNDSTVYVIPDVHVLQHEGNFKVMLNHIWNPQFQISSYYRAILSEEGISQEVINYIKEKLKQAQWLQQCITKRQETLLRCANAVVAKQPRFFRLGPGWLAPLNLADIAEEMDIHPSTVSRTVNQTYLECKWGIFSLSYFFPKAVGSEEDGCIKDTIKAAIRNIIEKENKKKPYSDIKIADILKERGIDISRRTVAKYRDEMFLPAAPGRKLL